MIKGLERAEAALRPRLAVEAVWFAPPDERHLDVPATMRALGEALIIAFMAGMTAEAKEWGEAKGKEIFKWLTGFTKELFQGQTPKPKEDVSALAGETQKIARTSSPQKILVYAEKTERRTQLYFESYMDSGRASKLAADLRKTIFEHILNTGA